MSTSKVLTTPTSTVAITRYGSYSSDFNVFICRQCKYAINNTSIISYFKKTHSKLLTKEEELTLDNFIKITLIKSELVVELPTFHKFYFEDLELYS